MYQYVDNHKAVKYAIFKMGPADDELNGVRSVTYVEDYLTQHKQHGWEIKNVRVLGVEPDGALRVAHFMERSVENVPHVKSADADLARSVAAIEQIGGRQVNVSHDPLIE